MSSYPMKMSNCIWQQQKCARPETYLARLVLAVAIKNDDDSINEKDFNNDEKSKHTKC